LECHFIGSITQTIFLGDRVVYKMFTKHLKKMILHLGSSLFTRSAAVLFDLRSSLSYWKICRAIRAGNEFVPLCLNSHSVTPDMFDSNAITKMALGETLPNSLLAAYNTNALRDHYYLRSLISMLENEVLLKYNTSYPDSQYLSMELSTELMFPLHTDSIVLLDDIATNFLSCYKTPVLRFEMYVKPFQLELWLSIGSCLLAIAIFIYVYKWKQKLSPSFSPFFFFVSTLVEEPYSVPTALWNDSKFKTITITWLLTAVIFTNLYAGLMISDLTVPLKGEILHSLEDIFGAYDENDLLFRASIEADYNFWWYNYTLLHMPNDMKFWITDPRKTINYSKFDTYHKQFREMEHFALLQAPATYKDRLFKPANETQRLGNPHMYKFFTRFLQDARSVYLKPNTFNPRYEFYVAKFISPKYRHYPRDPQFPRSENGLLQHFMAAAVEKEIVECGRSIFIAELTEIRPELVYLKRNYPETTFYIGYGTIESGRMRKLFWKYDISGNVILAEYLKHLLQAGIRTHILRIQSHKNYLERRTGTSFIKEMEPPAMGMGMNGSIQTIFIILVAILAVASSVFLFEIMYSRQNTLFTLVEHFS
jgi:hypothetical protein